MTSEIARIIAGFSPIEMELYLSIGGEVPESEMKSWRREQAHRSEAVEALAMSDLYAADEAEARRELSETAA